MLRYLTGPKERRMRGTTFTMVASACVLAGLGMAAGCNGSGGSSDVELGGRAAIALMGVPADGTCIQVTAAGYRTVTDNFTVQAGDSSVFEMDGLPLGSVTFSAAAFGGACPPAAGTTANWVNNAPFTTTIAVDPPALVTLTLVRNGNADVTIGFDDGASAGASGGAGTSGTGGGGAGGSSGRTELMQVAGIMGSSTISGFEGAFTLDSFTLGASTPTSASAGTGAGAGAAKTTWTATASLRYQQGVPDLYGSASKLMAEKTVTLAEVRGGAMPTVIWKATMTNALIKSIQTSSQASDSAVPDLTVSFAFQRLTVEVDPLNPDGTAGTAIVDAFDLATNVNPPAPNPPVPLTFVVGGSVMGLETASAFQAPSETVPVSLAAGAGAAAGKPSFTDASISVPIDASALGMLAEEVDGRVTAMASVQLEALNPDGTLGAFGTYGFKNVIVTGMSLSGTTATVSFTAAAFKWSQGTTVVTFP
jgi:type VI protein secretion system component Hcp